MAAKNLAASGVLYTDRRDFYIDPQVVKELWTDVAPFTTVISNKETRQTNDPVFKMFEHRNPWVKQKFVNAGETETIAADGTESNALNIDGIVGLDSDVTDAWEGLVCEIWNSAETTKQAIVLITDKVDADEIKVKALWTNGGGNYTLVNDDVRVSTVEHLLSALACFGIDNVRVDVSSPEIPIMDGSAAPFVFLLQSAGIREQKAAKKFVRVKKSVTFEQDGKSASFRPFNGFKLNFAIHYDHPV